MIEPRWWQPPFTLRQQIEEVERELKLRESVYPRQVSSGKMRQSVADFHIGRMIFLPPAICGLDGIRR
jgi:hypothetical protein